MDNMTIKQYAEYITVMNSNTPAFITFLRQTAMPSILSPSHETVEPDDVTWYSSKDKCIEELEEMIKSHAVTFSDAMAEATHNQPNFETLSHTDIAKYYIARQCRRSSGNLVVDDQFIVFTNVYDETIDGPFMIIVDGETYGIATNHGLNGISGYIVDMMA